MRGAGVKASRDGVASRCRAAGRVYAPSRLTARGRLFSPSAKGVGNGPGRGRGRAFREQVRVL